VARLFDCLAIENLKRNITGFQQIAQEIIFIAIKIKKRTTNPLGFVKAFIVRPLRLFEFGLAALQLTRT
jgi:hypothetical protein